MSNAPYRPRDLKYRYRASIPAADRALRPAIDDGLFHHGEVGATLSVINEVANQLDLDTLAWCHFMEDKLHAELRKLHSREDILRGLHTEVAARRHQEGGAPQD